MAGTGAQFGWLEWGGHVAVDAVRGLSLHDVRFRGQRIAYELATQELYVSYNGYSGAPLPLVPVSAGCDPLQIAHVFCTSSVRD